MTRLGDIIYSLLAVSHLGGGKYIIEPNNRAFQRPMDYKTCKWMCELLETQSYIKETEIKVGAPYTHNFDTFRDHLLYGRHLAKTHWLTINLKEGYDLAKKWFSVDSIQKAPIIISKTSRRPGALNWSLLENYKDHCLFIGLESELKNIPVEIPYYKINSLLEYAKIIAGAKLIIANQTFTFALAEAMKLPRILEIHIIGPNCMPEKNTNGYLEITEELLKGAING